MKKARILIVALLVVAALLPAQVFAQQKPIVLRLAETHPQDYPTTKGDY